MSQRVFSIIATAGLAACAWAHAGTLVLRDGAYSPLTIRYRSPITRAVVDAADYSVNNGMGYVGDPTRDNSSGSFSWGEAYLLKSYNQMYRATGDRAYLDKFITHADGVLAKRNDHVPINTAANPSQAHYKVNGQDVAYDKPLWALSGHGYTSASVTSGHIVQGMSRFARIVSEDPALAASVYDLSTGQTYGQKAQQYIVDTLLTLDTIDSLLLIYTPHGTSYKAYPDGSPFAPPGNPPDLDAANADAPPSAALFDLYKATGNVEFLSRAQRTMRTLRGAGTFTTEQGNLAWSYGYGNPPSSDPEDVSHGGIVAPVIATMANDALASPGLYNSQDFTASDALSFAHAYMQEAYLGNGYSTSGMEGSDALEDRYNNPNMDDAEWASGVAGGMIDLAQFDLRLLPMAQAVQLRYYGLDNRPPTTSNNPVAWPVEGYANLYRYSFVPQEMQISVQAGNGQDIYRTIIPTYADLNGPAELVLVNQSDPGDVRRLLVTLGGNGSEWDRLWNLTLTLDASAAGDLIGHDISLTMSLLDGIGSLKNIFGSAPPAGFGALISESGHQIVFDGALAASGVFMLRSDEHDIALNLPGDADLDGDVDLSDLGALASFYGQSNDMLWPQGDFDLDGDVDLSDLGALATNYGDGYASAIADFNALHVPEPAMALLAPLTLFWRFR